MKKRKIILLHLDAVSWKFLDDNLVPRLSRLLSEGTWSRLNSFIMFEGITSTMFTGTWPEKNNVWTHFLYDREKSHYRNLGWMSLFEQRTYADRCHARRFLPLPVHLYLRLREKMGVDREAWRYQKIPLEYRSHFALSLPDYTAITANDCFGESLSVFKILRDHGFSTYDLFGDFKRIIQRFQSEPLLDMHDVFFIHTLMDLDQTAHACGPESSAAKEYVARQDELIAKFAEVVRSQRDEVYIVLFSDHGMTPVHGYIDVLDAVEEVLKREDCAIFVDSTLLRAWGTPAALGWMTEKVSDIPHCRLLSREELRTMHLNFPHNKYGDLIFAAEEGYVFNPNFWEGEAKVRGMHGYHSTSDYLTAFVGIVGNGVERRFVERRADMVDIFSTILDVAGIRHPEKVEGRSLLLDQGKKTYE